MRHYSFPSIGQFRDVVKNTIHRARYIGKDENGDPKYDPWKVLPKINFIGTVKLHGTNSSIVRKGDETWCQSRERIIDVEKDNAGFAFFVASLGEDTVNEMFNTIIFLTDGTDHAYREGDAICIYGEWCGGNIQKSVALNGLPKMFVIFGIKFVANNGDNDEDHRWVPVRYAQQIKFEDKQVFNIYDFMLFHQEIDFEKPHLAQVELGKFTLDVENECPVGHHFGVDGTGEGIVWRAMDTEADRLGFRVDDLVFKVKGEKHSVSKVKTLAAVDVEKVNSIMEFVDNTVTDNRCNQGLDKLREQGLEIEMVNLGPFIKFISNDVFKEELDTLIASGLTPKEVGKAISVKARNWFLQNLSI